MNSAFLIQWMTTFFVCFHHIDFVHSKDGNIARLCSALMQRCCSLSAMKRGWRHCLCDDCCVSHVATSLRILSGCFHHSIAGNYAHLRWVCSDCKPLVEVGTYNIASFYIFRSTIISGMGHTFHCPIPAVPSFVNGEQF